MTRTRSLYFLALTALVGCAGLLGFEDIVVETRPEPVPPDAADTPMPPLPTGEDAGKRCSPGGAIKKQTLLTALIGAGFGELRPRLTADERTITFERLVAAVGSTQYRSQSFIARRPTHASDFATPELLFDGGLVSPAPDGDGTWIYFVDGTNAFRIGGETGIRERITPSDPPPSQPDYFGGAGDPTLADATGELFFESFAGAKRTIQRVARRGAAFGPPERVRWIEVGDTPGEFTSYVEPVISRDGRRLYYGTQTFDADGGARKRGNAFVATRDELSGLEFGSQKSLDGFEPGTASVGWVSADECRLYTYRLTGGVFRIFVEERDPE